MLRTWTQNAPLRAWKDAKGNLDIWKPKSTIFVTRVRGHMSLDMTRELMAAIDSTLRSVPRDGVVDHYYDWLDMTSYDSDSRVALAEWGAKRVHRIGNVWVCTSNRVAIMGLSVMNLVLDSKLKACPSLEALDAAIAAYTQTKKPVVPSAT